MNAQAADRATAIGRIVRSADFTRVLGRRAVARTDHFAAHHAPSAETAAPDELSTGRTQTDAQVVDEPVWLGLVIPKRNARRAVTRNLMKRQARQAAARHRGAMNGGFWVLRLHAPFDRSRFSSAASIVLKNAVRQELDLLLGGVQQAARR